MAFNVNGPTEVRGGYTEILKFPVGDDAKWSIVIDASTVASASGSGARLIKAGTLLSKNSNNQYERFTAASGQAIRGVLAYDVEVGGTGPEWDKPAAMFFHGCVFRADRIVDFNTHGVAARSALPTCRFE